jgi:hypothetical protein
LNIRIRNIGLEKRNENGLPTQSQLLRKLTFILIFSISLISCKNVKTESSCEFDFFENSSGMKFPESVKIIDCEDDLEGLIWLHLKFDQKSTMDFIKKNEMHQYSNKLENSLWKFAGIDDSELIEGVATYLNENVKPISKDQYTYLKTVETEHQSVIYVINKSSGYFWGQIGYPDWSGD